MNVINLVVEYGIWLGNFLSEPVWITNLSIVIFALHLYYYRTWTKPKIALTIGVVSTVLLLICMLHPWVYHQITLPRHVPAVAILFLTGFFGWFSLRRAAINDSYIEQGREIPDKTEAEKDVLTWPDLVFTEFISTLFVSVVLMVWSLTLLAPLEEPANPTSSPNPAKAPWYFLGLQELLVYYDPWIAGVLVPTLIIVGLMAIPYLDRNPKGSGYYTLIQRPFAVSFFLFGWYILWMLQIYRGTFLRGPNWAHFGLFEEWNTLKATSALNITLSDKIWVDLLNMAPPDIGATIPLGLMTLPLGPFIRELPGFIVLLLYFTIPPLILAKTWWRDLYRKLGFVRFQILCFLVLTTAAIPLKMYLRWLLNFKYFVEIQQLYFNI